MLGAKRSVKFYGMIYYNGFTNDKGKYKEGTKNYELVNMAKTKDDFTEDDIINRKNKVLQKEDKNGVK